MPQKGKHTPQGKKRKNKIPNISDANNAAGNTIGTPAHVITEKPLIKNNTLQPQTFRLNIVNYLRN